MSKPVKEMIMRTYQQAFEDVTDVVLVDIRGVPANDNNALRTGLAEKQIRVRVVQNALARKVFSDTALAPISDMMTGPTAVVYGGESVVDVAREIIDWAKKVKEMDVKGAVMEGTVFQADEIERLSKFPTRLEAQGEVIQVIIGPAGQVIGAATSAGSAIASILSTIEEKLEKGESIEKVA
ncbi:MAG: 50S ribosomal protein L10 [Phycisphaeraceae bacterium]